MMGAVRGWLLAVIAVSLLCAVADALMPPGGVRRVGRLVCGLVLMGAVLSPVAELDVEEGWRWLEDYLASVHSREAELTQTVESQRKVIIEQEYAAYIVDKAAELGVTCEARVECRRSEDGLYLPCRTEIAGPMTDGVRARLSQVIEEDLGVPESEQIIIDKEEMP